jgi:hypothetical protein
MVDSGVLISSGAIIYPPGRSFRLPDILDEVALRYQDLATKSSHVRVDVDGLAYPLHQPTVCSYQSRGHGLPARHHLVLSL